jgi:hypothetical protein
VENTLDEDVRDRFHRFERRLEHLGATLAEIEKRLSDGFWLD